MRFQEKADKGITEIAEVHLQKDSVFRDPESIAVFWEQRVDFYETEHGLDKLEAELKALHEISERLQIFVIQDGLEISESLAESAEQDLSEPEAEIIKSLQEEVIDAQMDLINTSVFVSDDVDGVEKEKSRAEKSFLTAEDSDWIEELKQKPILRLRYDLTIESQRIYEKIRDISRMPYSYSCSEIEEAEEHARLVELRLKLREIYDERKNEINKIKFDPEQQEIIDQIKSLDSENIADKNKLYRISDDLFEQFRNINGEISLTEDDEEKSELEYRRGQIAVILYRCRDKLYPHEQIKTGEFSSSTMNEYYQSMLRNLKGLANDLDSRVEKSQSDYVQSRFKCFKSWLESYDVKDYSEIGYRQVGRFLESQKGIENLQEDLKKHGIDISRWVQLINKDIQRMRQYEKETQIEKKYALDDENDVIVTVKGGINDGRMDIKIKGKDKEFNLAEFGSKEMTFATTQPHPLNPLKSIRIDRFTKEILFPFSDEGIQENFSQYIFSILHEIGHANQPLEEQSELENMVRARLGEPHQEGFELLAQNERNAWIRAFSYVRDIMKKYKINVLAPFKSFDEAVKHCKYALGDYEAFALRSLGKESRGLFLKE